MKNAVTRPSEPSQDSFVRSKRVKDFALDANKTRAGVFDLEQFFQAFR